MSSAPFDPYHKWLGIPRRDQPAHHYRLLGIPLYEDDPQVVEAAADRQMAFLRKFQSGEHSADALKLLNEVSRRICLLKAATKAAYDESLRAELAASEPATPWILIPRSTSHLDHYGCHRWCSEEGGAHRGPGGRRGFYYCPGLLKCHSHLRVVEVAAPALRLRCPMVRRNLARIRQRRLPVDRIVSLCRRLRKHFLIKTVPRPRRTRPPGRCWPVRHLRHASRRARFLLRPAPHRPSIPGFSREPVRLRWLICCPRVDVVQHRIAGQWLSENRQLISPATGMTRLGVPYALPDEELTWH